MNLKALWAAPLLIAASAPAETLPEMAPETMAAVLKYRNCVVAKSLALEPAGETADETVRISVPTCSEDRLLASAAILNNFRLSNGNFDAGRDAVITIVNRQVNEETVQAAKLAVITKRAERATNAQD